MFHKIRHWLSKNLTRRCCSVTRHMASPWRAKKYRPRLEPLESRIVPGFLAASSYPATVPGGIPNTIVMADFNHDGILDVATANYGANSASILLGNGDGSFGSPITYPAGGNPQGL